MNNNPHLATSRLEYLDRQKNLYESIKPELVDRYLGEFIAFDDGRFLDHERNEGTHKNISIETEAEYQRVLSIVELLINKESRQPIIAFDRSQSSSASRSN